MRLAGAHVLVTGASRGIGALVAEHAARRGALVTVVARSEQPLRALADRVDGRALPVDLADPEQRRDLVQRAEDEAGDRDRGQVLLESRVRRTAHRGVVLGAEVLDDHFLDVTVPAVRGTDTVVR